MEQRPSIVDWLPRVYHRLLPSFFRSRVPAETAATCSDCAMCATGSATVPGARTFSAKTKCCTYYPGLPNFLVGGLLSTRARALAKGRQRMLDTIASRVGVTPQGLAQPAKYSVLTRSGPDAFGKAESLLCPFYGQPAGTCTIRSFWNATCATWFCKHRAGQDGWLFWQALKQYLLNAENALRQHALFELGWEPSQIIRTEPQPAALSARDMEGRPPDADDYRRLWHDWVGREAELYRRTFRVVSRLSPGEFERLAGISQKVLLASVQARHENLVSPQLPPVLRRNPELKLERLSGDSCVLIGYSPLDALSAPAIVHRMLDFFDGRRPNGDVCGTIREQLGAEPDRSLLTTLYRMRVLIA